MTIHVNILADLLRQVRTLSPITKQCFVHNSDRFADSLHELFSWKQRLQISNAHLNGMQNSLKTCSTSVSRHDNRSCRLRAARSYDVTHVVWGCLPSRPIRWAQICQRPAGDTTTERQADDKNRDLEGCSIASTPIPKLWLCIKYFIKMSGSC